MVNIAYGANRELCGEDFQDAVCDLKSKGDAVTMLGNLTSFDFIVSFLVLYEFLSHLSGITVKLQGQSVDTIKEYQEVQEIVYNNIYLLSTVKPLYYGHQGDRDKCAHYRGVRFREVGFIWISVSRGPSELSVIERCPY